MTQCVLQHVLLTFKNYCPNKINTPIAQTCWCELESWYSFWTYLLKHLRTIVHLPTPNLFNSEIIWQQTKKKNWVPSQFNCCYQQLQANMRSNPEVSVRETKPTNLNELLLDSRIMRGDNRKRFIRRSAFGIEKPGHKTTNKSLHYGILQSYHRKRN